jgi:integrase
MRGHIVKRYKSSYTIYLNLGRDPVTGKRKQLVVSVKGTKRQAEQKLADLIHGMDIGNYIKPNKVTLGEFLGRWMKDYVWRKLSPRVAEGYDTIVRCHLIPKLGSIYLTQLRTDHLQTYYSETLAAGRVDKTGGLSAQTLVHHHTILHKALEDAIEQGLLFRNVASLDSAKPPPAEHREMLVWSEDELVTFIQAAKKTPYYALFYVVLFTGMRRSEFMALRWSDIDLTTNQLSVARTLHQLRDGTLIYRDTKTTKSRRTIALTPSTVKLLEEYRKTQEAKRAALHMQPLKSDDLVFCKPDGSELRPNTISRAWVDLAVRAGVKRIRLHDARHTHASIMLKQGTPAKVVQERLGHANVGITLDTYSHVAPGMQEDAALRFDDIARGKL